MICEFFCRSIIFKPVLPFFWVAKKIGGTATDFPLSDLCELVSSEKSLLSLCNKKKKEEVVIIIRSISIKFLYLYNRKLYLLLKTFLAGVLLLSQNVRISLFLQNSIAEFPWSEHYLKILEWNSNTIL